MPGRPIRLGLVGFGYWGRILFNEFRGDPRFTVCTIMTRRSGPAIPGVHWTDDLDRIAADRLIEAVVVATPVRAHHPVSSRLLAAGKHLFVEKPLAATGDEARDLRRLAIAAGCHVFVDYTFSVLPGIARLRALVSSGEIGVVEGIRLSMTQLGRFSDVDVYHTLASHMLAVLQQLVPLNQLRLTRRDMVSRAGAAETGSVLFELIGTAPRWFSQQLRGTIDVSLNHPAKTRRAVLYGREGTVVYDMTAPAPVTVVRYDRHHQPSIPLMSLHNVPFSGRGLPHSLTAFYDVLTGQRSSNLRDAVAINDALDILGGATAPSRTRGSYQRRRLPARMDERQDPVDREGTEVWDHVVGPTGD